MYLPNLYTIHIHKYINICLNIIVKCDRQVFFPILKVCTYSLQVYIGTGNKPWCVNCVSTSITLVLRLV